MDYSALFPILFRYIVLALLYVIVFANFSKVSIQFLLFMVIMILNFFLVIFVGRDMINSAGLMKAVYGTFTEMDAPEYKNPFVVYFVWIIGLTVLLSVCSISIVLAVFDYGKKTTNDFISYTLTPANTLLINQFEVSYQTYIIYLALFVYFVIFAHTSGPAKVLMFNIACILFSIIIVATSIYSCYISVRFLDNKKYKRQLYQ
jgi:hypothetical protein